VSVLVPIHRPAEQYARRPASASTDRAQPQPNADGQGRAVPVC